jgi:hypothetical protein
MLKIVGTNGKHVTNEKILIDDKNKLTKYGVIIILLDVLADIGFFFVMSRVVKTLKKRKE